MRFGSVNIRVIAVLFAVGIGACKKGDEVPPQVVITSPSEGTVFSVYDTVFVSFEITDESQLTRATAELVNSNFIPITPKVDIQDFNGSESLIIDNKLLETGDYYVLVTASDGLNEKREYRQIRIIAIPKKRRACYVATGSGSGQYAIWEIDSLFQQSNLWLQPGQDVIKLCVNSMYDQLTIAGFFSSGLKTYGLSSGTLEWSDDVFSVSQTQRYMDLACFSSSIYTTIYDREIRSYSTFGSLNMNLPTGIYRPEMIYTNGQYLLVEMNLVGDDRQFLYVYNASTNMLLWQTDFQVDIVSVCPLQNDEVLVFGNDGTQARVFHYDIGSNSWWEPRQLPAGKILKAVNMEGNIFAISHENGVYSYTYSPNYLNQIKVGQFQDIGFDVDKGTLIAASGNQIEEMTQIGQTVNTISLADSIVSFDIHFTR